MTVEEFIDESANEVLVSLEMSELKIGEVEEEVRVSVPAPTLKPTVVILPEIAPTEDPGPRYVEPSPEPPAKPVAAPKLNPPPKRHPRNVPRFSRLK